MDEVYTIHRTSNIRVVSVLLEGGVSKHGSSGPWLWGRPPEHLQSPKALEITSYLFLIAVAVGVYGSDNFHKHTLPSVSECGTSDRGPHSLT